MPRGGTKEFAFGCMPSARDVGYVGDRVSEEGGEREGGGREGADGGAGHNSGGGDEAA